MASSDAGTWLQQALLRLCSDPRSCLQLDPDVVASLVSYCQLAPPSDAQEYLFNMIGNENCKDIVTEYLHRRGVAGSAESGDVVQDGVMQVYVKPQMDESWTSGNKKTIRNPKSRNLALDGKIGSTTIDSANGHGSSGPGVKGKSGGSKVKRGGKGISLAEAAEGRMLISRGAPCTCQASRHNLVNNCLSCGKIVCEQEGEGPCNYCGALVLREGSTYAGLEGVTLPVSESEAAAQVFKDRLVEFGRTSSQRTTVIDDQSDYFQIDGNAWLSEEEKKSLQRQQQELEEAEEARKKKLVVTIDLLGRKVVMADDSDSDISMKISILGGNTLEKRFSEVRSIRPNPFVLDKPVFLDVVQSKYKESGKFNIPSNRRRGDTLHDERFARSGRVQHDDVFVSSVDSITFQEAQDSQNDELWENLKSKERISQSPFEDEECLMDSGSAQSSSVFDICEPQTDVTKREMFSLSPSILIQKQMERKRVAENCLKSVNILMPGMILLKHWLSQTDQVEIVKKCRDLGVGPGGFYQPGYETDNKMHLLMMSLGMNWEPTMRAYTSWRSYDNARPPDIPPLFLMLVERALSAARHSLHDESRSKDSKGNMDVVPDMRPNICLVNFYERNGRLGLHQDRDESQESLQKGIPVVSFSIGDSADFLYGVKRDADMAESIMLESGDVLIFGGSSRMIFHGVSRIHPMTAPSWLIDETKLRPGRINLTFRQL